MEKRLLLALVILACVMTGVPTRGDVTRYIRYTTGSEAAFGVLEGSTIHELAGNFLDTKKRTGKTLSLKDVTILAPTEPGKVIAVGLNYRDHLGDRSPAKYPGLFAKFPTCIIGQGKTIVVPGDAKYVAAEAEIVIVIGKKAHNVSIKDAPKYIFGVTCGNDVSERTWQRDDLQWFRGKGTDTFGPMGPVIATGLDLKNIKVKGRVNGVEKQSSSSAYMIFDIATQVSYISHYVTLMPGDVIFTGTPGTAPKVDDGDVVEIEVEGVGVLKNPVKRSTTSYASTNGLKK